MKKEDYLIFIRRKIFWRNLLIGLLLYFLAIPVGSRLLHLYPIKPFAGLLVLLFHPFAAILVTMFEIWKGVDQKEAEIIVAKTEKLSSEIQTIENNLRTLKSTPVSFAFVPGRPYIFQLTLAVPATSKEVPSVTVNHQLVTTSHTPTGELLCYGKQAIKIDAEKLEIVCHSEKNNVTVPNPYHMHITTENIRWQCEGHTREKRIYIDGSCLLSAKDPDVHYEFQLLVNGTTNGIFGGTYDAEKDKLIISIGTVDKQDVVKKECFIRPSFDKKYSIKLPEPEVLSVNFTNI